MREHISRQKKTTTGFSIPSLKQPIRGFGSESSAISRQSPPEIQPLHKPVTHDFSRIPLHSPQAKLSISQPGDKYEQEADSVAQQVMQTMAQPVNRQSTQREALPEEELQMKPLDISTLQREALPEDEEELRMKSLDISTLQREALPEDEEELQMMPMVQRQASMAATPDVETSINQARGGGQPMADNIRHPMEQAFGADFSRVKVHTDGQSDQLNRSIQARAFTTGQDVFFRSGEYNPGSRGGQELLAHELTHVVQQSGGAVQQSLFQPFISGKIIQRTWNTSGDEQVYRDNVHEVNWHLCSDGKLWYETYQESSPYAGYAGIKNKGSYAKWFMLGTAPFDLLKEQASTIQIPNQGELDPKFHEAYRLYVYLIGISTLQWDDIKEKQPFANLGWQVKKVYEHYQKHVNPLVEKEDGGLNAYYLQSYKIMNPFLRAIHEKFGDERYDQIIEGNIGNDSAELVEILKKISEKAKFNSQIDERSLREVLAQIKGAKKEIKKNFETKPIDNTKIPTVYRGDFVDLVDIMAEKCGFDKAALDEKGKLNINKTWTQFQFVSTTTNKQIGSPAHTGTIWNITLGAKSMGKLGGLYQSEAEVLFAPKTKFLIERIVTAKEYDNSGPKGDSNTRYIVYAHEG